MRRESDVSRRARLAAKEWLDRKAAGESFTLKDAGAKHGVTPQRVSAAVYTMRVELGLARLDGRGPNDPRRGP